MPAATSPLKPQQTTTSRASEITSIRNSIRALTQSLRVAGRRAEQDLGISAAQLYVLQELAEKPAATLNELAQRTFTHQSSVSIVVNRLVAGRLVTRTPSRDDGRRLSISLTSAGRALLRRAPENAEARLARALKSLSARDRRGLMKCLTHLADKLNSAR